MISPLKKYLSKWLQYSDSKSIIVSTMISNIVHTTLCNNFPHMVARLRKRTLREKVNVSPASEVSHMHDLNMSLLLTIDVIIQNLPCSKKSDHGIDCHARYLW